MTSIESLLKSIPTAIYLNEVDFSSENDEQIEKLASFIEKNENIKSIHYSNQKISLFDFIKAKPVLRAIQNNKNASQLCLDNCSLEELDKRQVDILIELIKLSNIRRLTAEKNNFRGICPALDIFIELPQLPVQELSLGLTDFSNLPFETKRSIVQGFTKGKLISLSLAFTSFYSDQTQKLPNESEGALLLPLFDADLQKLSLRSNPLGCEITNDNWESYDNLITYDDWEKIFKAINERGVLKSLDLSSCKLNSVVEREETRDFVGLLESFLKQTTLNKIDISDNGFSHEVSLRLIKAAMYNKNLTLVFEERGKSVNETQKVNSSSKNVQVGQERKESSDLPHDKTLIHSNDLNHSVLQKTKQVNSHIVADKGKFKL